MKTIIALILLCVCCTSCGNNESSKSNSDNNPKEPTTSITKISSDYAVEKAKQFVGSSGWVLANISNTGVVSQNITSSRLRSLAEGLMDKDGKAGQWVVEFYKDTPKSVEEDGKKGFNYPYKIVLVTANGAEPGGPDIDEGVNVPKGFSPLKEELVNNTRNLAFNEYPGYRAQIR